MSEQGNKNEEKGQGKKRKMTSVECQTLKKLKK